MSVFVGRSILYALLSALLAVPVTLLLLHLFKRSVVRGMRTATAGEPPPAQAVPAVREPRSGPALTWRSADRSLLLPLAAYVLGGIVFALVFVVVMMMQADEFSVAAVALFLPKFCTPMVVAGWVVLPPGARRRLFTAASLGVGFLFAIVPIIVYSVSVLEVLQVYVVPTLPALMLILLFMTRRVRAAGPLVLAVVTGSVLGWNLILDAAETSAGVWGFLASIERALSGPVAVALIFFVGSAAGVLAMWPVLRLLGEAYEHKLLSDQSLALDVLFGWFAVFFGIEMAVESPVWALSALVAFGAYRVVATVCFFILKLARTNTARADILLLRPFALGRRSEKLFDGLSRVWLRLGAIHMIAGPDLVMSTVSPPEFLVFLGGRLSRRFLTTQADVQRHLAALDLTPDPDGRYRVNQLFCGDDVWRAAMSGLAAISAAVLMDLRGFTSANQGCAYEVGELIRSVPLRRVVFVVDHSTEVGFLEYVAESVRAQLPADSPNAAPGMMASRVVPVDGSAAGRTAIVRALIDSTAA